VNRSANPARKSPKEYKPSCPRRSVIHPESHNNTGPVPFTEYATRPAGEAQYLTAKATHPAWQPTSARQSGATTLIRPCSLTGSHGSSYRPDRDDEIDETCGPDLTSHPGGAWRDLDARSGRDRKRPQVLHAVAEILDSARSTIADARHETCNRLPKVRARWQAQVPDSGAHAIEPRVAIQGPRRQRGERVGGSAMRASG
jgi:hypothetical protein